MPVETSQELSPRPLMRILGDFANSQILDAALEYDFFTLIHRGLCTAEEIASEAGTNPRATRIVLDSLPAPSEELARGDPADCEQSLEL